MLSVPVHLWAPVGYFLFGDDAAELAETCDTVEWEFTTSTYRVPRGSDRLDRACEGSVWS